MARRVFISYAQESPEHRAEVLNLYALLREYGIDAHVDQIAAGERHDWSLWMADQIREADVVLCVASEQYRLRAEGQSDEQVGKGVQWEARLIRAAFYAAQRDLQKFVPVVLPGQTADGVPDFLAAETTTVYSVKDFTKKGAEDLLRFLWRKPKYAETPLGDEPDFDTVTPSVTSGGLNSIVSQQVAGMAEVIGRDEELADLRAAFTAQRKSRTPVVQVLTGMGGVGKTSLARAYAQRHLDDYEVVWWVRAEDPATVDGEYRSLLEEAHSAAEAKLVRNAVQVANTWLSKRTKPWLLVLDNIPDARSLQGLYPAKGNGHVLVTSQASSWPNPGAVHRIDPLDTDDAVGLLATLSQDDDVEAATKLATELGGLPLALTQAASFTFTNGTSLANYLRFYQDRSAELHADSQPDDYPHTVATTWLLAIEKMSPPARLALNTMAYFAPDSIPISVLHPLAGDELALTRVIGELHSHSLVARGAEDTITIHRLIQAVTRHGLGDAPEHAALARDLITAALPRRPFNLHSMSTWKRLRNHVSTVIDHLPATDPQTFDLRYLQAISLGEMGDMRGAIAQLTTLVDDMSPVLGLENERVLRARYGVAYWSNPYDPHQSLKLLSELREAQTRVLGAEHPDTMETGRDLARTQLTLGELDSARRVLDELLPIHVRVLGPDHEHTLTTRMRCATVLAERGRFDEAMAIGRGVIAAATTEFGEPDLRMTASWIEWGEILGQAGQPAAARDLYSQIVAQYAEHRGQYDRMTLFTSIPLAVWTAKAGNPKLARNMLLRTLSRIRDTLGKNDPLLVKLEEGLNNVRASGPAPRKR